MPPLVEPYSPQQAPPPQHYVPMGSAAGAQQQQVLAAQRYAALRLSQAVKAGLLPASIMNAHPNSYPALWRSVSDEVSAKANSLGHPDAGAWLAQGAPGARYQSPDGHPPLAHPAGPGQVAPPGAAPGIAPPRPSGAALNAVDITGDPAQFHQPPPGPSPMPNPSMISQYASQFGQDAQQFNPGMLGGFAGQTAQPSIPPQMLQQLLAQMMQQGGGRGGIGPRIY